MHIVIIGNGIAGITAARFIRKLSAYRITVISEETDHFFSRTALMYVYMGHMRYEDIKPYEDWFWSKNRIELVRDRVETVDLDARLLALRSGNRIGYDKLLLATGSQPNRFDWPGQDLEGVSGLYSYQDLQKMEGFSKGLQRAVVVGGGLIGIEMAEMFHSRNIPVTFLVREKSYWNMVLPAEESAMVNKQIRENGIDLRLETELKEIVDDGNGRVKGVLTQQGERIDCGFVGLTAGVHPNVGFLKNTRLEMDRGILVDDFLETNIKGVFAAGDCAQLRRPAPGRKSVEAVWYVGRIMGETAAYNLLGRSVPYRPGIWYNSAKFMHLEYQVYGDIRPIPPEGYKSFFWQHPDGRKSLRIQYEKGSGAVVGFNLMGMRYRQEVCERWIRRRTPITEVLPDLKLANFDPEFFSESEAVILQLFNHQEGTEIRAKSKRNLRQVMAFLKKP